MCLLVMLLSSCARPGIVATDEARNATAQPSAQLTDLLSPGDQLEIMFPSQPDWNSTQFIREDGLITLPDVGDVHAAGLSVTELRQHLNDSYAHTLLVPNIEIFVRQRAARIFVGGEVGQPGAQPLTSPTTVLQAILAAQGFKPTAELDQVLLIRRAPDGKTTWQVLDLTQALDTQNIAADMDLVPRDVVFVPRTKIANVGVWVDNYIRQLLPLTPGLQLPLQ